jgi:putative methyltransferase
MKSIYFLSLNIIRFVPYAYGLLRCYAEQDEEIVKNYLWKEPLCQIAPAATIRDNIIDPDFLCASCYVWNLNQHLEIAKQVKQRYPHCKIIMGGPHIPDKSDLFFSRHPHIDILVHGEGEVPFRNLLKELLKPSPELFRIAGISFNADKKAIKTANSDKLPKDLPVPSPYLKGVFNHFLNVNATKTIALLETNRGCPYSCAFCDWGVRTMNKVRQHDMERIDREIQSIAKKKVEDIYITDANFGMLKRDLDIARVLVACKNRYGFPKRVRIQFSKKTNNTVFEISKLLHHNDMLWGTTLSLQSVNLKVIEAVGRPHIDMETYRKTKESFAKENIPTYTELILGLPLETKDSFIQGICSLFDIGMHDDFRVFELALLPNAPLSQQAQREKYQLHTKRKPIRTVDPGCETEYIELVFGTSTMPQADWADCLLFAEMAQALHNGGYTRFIATYLSTQHRFSYVDFYVPLLSFILNTDAESFKSFKRVQRLIRDYYEDPDMPQVNRILTQPDMMAFLNGYNPDRKGWPLWSYIWLSISEKIDCFYTAVQQHLEDQGVIFNEKMNDLMRYQKDLMITLDYDPQRGKHVMYDHDWHEFFFNNEPLRQKPVSYHYRDKKMGTSFRYELVKNNRKQFVTAAIGYSYPYSKFRHFYHQPDMTRT